MKKAVAAVVVGLLLPMSSVIAATKDVDVVDRRFVQDNISVAVGDIVHWTTAGTQEGHNVREDGKRSNGTNGGTPIFNSGRETDFIDFKMTFSAGTFHYYCRIHGTPNGGMDGTIKVPVKLAAKPSGPNFTVMWATSATQTGSKFDVQFRIGSASWHDWHKGTAALKGVFGAAGTPADAALGTKYSFRARSHKGDAVSKWSPVGNFTP